MAANCCHAGMSIKPPDASFGPPSKEGWSRLLPDFDRLEARADGRADKVRQSDLYKGAVDPEAAEKKKQRLLEGPRSDHQPLNFTGAFVNFRDSGVTVGALDGIFAAVAVSAVNLNGFVRYARGHFTGEQLGHSGVLAEASSAVLLPRCLANQQTRGID